MCPGHGRSLNRHASEVQLLTAAVYFHWGIKSPACSRHAKCISTKALAAYHDCSPMGLEVCSGHRKVKGCATTWPQGPMVTHPGMPGICSADIWDMICQFCCHLAWPEQAAVGLHSRRLKHCTYTMLRWFSRCPAFVSHTIIGNAWGNCVHISVTLHFASTHPLGMHTPSGHPSFGTH